MGYNYRQIAEQSLQESLEKLKNNPLPAYHTFALNPANQQFLNRPEPHKQIRFFDKWSWLDFFFGRDDDPYYVKDRPAPAIMTRLIYALMALAFALGAAYWIYSTFKTNDVLAKDGVVAQAKVVDLQTVRRTVRSNPSRTDTDYHLTYELTVTGPDGKTQVYRKTETVSSGFYSQHKIGGPVQVIYLPSNPDTALLSGTGDQLGMTLLIALAIAPICLITSFYNFWQFGRRLRKRQALKKGQYLSGYIYSSQIKNSLFGKPASVMIGYRFTNPSGQSLVGQAKFPARYFKARWHLIEERKPVTVLYHNDKKFEVM